MPVRFIGPSDPLSVAVQEAVENELLAQEALERDVGDSSRAQMIRALLRDKGIQKSPSERKEISSSEVRKWYELNAALFDEVDTVTVTFIRTDDGTVFESFLRDEKWEIDDFMDFADTMPEDVIAESRVKVHLHSAPAMAQRIVNASKTNATIGYDYDSASGEYWVVRSDDVVLEPTEWTSSFETRARVAMDYTNEQHAITKYAKELEENKSVQRHTDNIADFGIELRRN